MWYNELLRGLPRQKCIYGSRGDLYRVFFFQICQLIIVVAGPGLVCRYKSGLRSPHHHFPPFGNRGDNIVSQCLHQREEKGKKILQLGYQGLISYLISCTSLLGVHLDHLFADQKSLPKAGIPQQGEAIPT